MSCTQFVRLHCRGRLLVFLFEAQHCLAGFEKHSEPYSVRDEGACGARMGRFQPIVLRMQEPRRQATVSCLKKCAG